MRVWTWLGSVVGAAIVGLALVFLAGKTVMPTLLHAQDAGDTDAGETVRVYYESEVADDFDIALLYQNVCLESVQHLNPELDVLNVRYGQELLLPADEPCYQESTQSGRGWAFAPGRPPRLKYYEDGQWLDEPYYSDEVVYTRANSVEEIAAEYDACVDDLLADNILLQNFVTYREFAGFTTLDVFIPQDALPCNPNLVEGSTPLHYEPVELTARDVTPFFIATTFNVCAEEMPSTLWSGLYAQTDLARLVSVHVPTNAPPCYNDAGQRLIYFDLEGRRLEQPTYSNLEIYLVSPGETLESIAQLKSVCVVDLLRINGFPDLPTLNSGAEFFIPPPRPCSEAVEIRSVSSSLSYLQAIANEFNICPEVLLNLNAHFINYFTGWQIERGVYNSHATPIIVPTNVSPCYGQYNAVVGDSLFDAELKLNVCFEEFIPNSIYSSIHTRFFYSTVLNYHLNTLPCYNEVGQRLYYPVRPRNFSLAAVGTERVVPSYSSMPIHRFEFDDTVYSVSQQYNVCVHDLLAVNPTLNAVMTVGYPTFIPDTRPCYDEGTGMPLIYEDASGNPLPQPRVADELRYYGSQALGRVSYYYNVCVNRIESANSDKIDQGNNPSFAYSLEELGWVIPTDRPPCYDATGTQIEYVCYRQPMDFNVDYRQIAEKVTFDQDGTYCYDLVDPATRIVYNNEAYQLLHYERNYLLTSRAFTAWCYGVSLDAINAINEVDDILEVLPLWTRAIPLATRACYLDDPSLLDNTEVYEVQRGDLLTSIAARTDVPWWEIAAANDITVPYTIWPRQLLIIPDQEG